MKKLLIVGLILIGLVGAGCSRRISMANVKNTFPTAEIQPCPNADFCWLVLESNKVYWVTNDGDRFGEVDRAGAQVIKIFDIK